MLSPSIAGVLFVALVGWFATIRLISASKLSHTKKQWLIVPAWIPWLIFALGAPILAGSLSIPTAINLGGSITMGMATSIVFSQRRQKR